MALTKVKLPGVKFLGTVNISSLEEQLMEKSLAGMQIGINKNIITPIEFFGVPSVDLTKQNNKNALLEEVRVVFDSTEDVSLYKRSLVVTDTNGHSWLIGKKEKPRPIVKMTRKTGKPSGDANAFSYEVSLYEKRALIPVIIM